MLMNKRTRKYILAIGSNIGSDQPISEAIELLQKELGPISLTPVICTEAVGISAAPFKNCLASGETDKNAEELRQISKQIEQLCGDQKSLRAENKIVMDIDLMLLGSKKYHIKDWDRDYIRQLMGMPPIR